MLDMGVFEDDTSVLSVEVCDFRKGQALYRGGGGQELGGRGAGGDEERWGTVRSDLSGEVSARGRITDYEDFLVGNQDKRDRGLAGLTLFLKSSGLR